MKCNSSRKGTNVSCLRSSRRKMLLSFSTTPRAESGSKRISDDTVFSVLNKKCGLIWLESASMRAFSSNCWCRSRFISIRVLFQIFSGAATDISVARTQSASHHSHCGSIANSHFGLVATASATRPSSRPTHASSGSNSHDTLRSRTKRTTSRGIFKNVNGPKFQRSSLLGIAWRIKPPSNPAVVPAFIPIHSCAAKAGMVMIAPPIGPTTRPPSKPIRNAPSSERSAKRYGNPTKRSETPTISGGVMNNISFSFWSGSRSSVKSTRRNVFQRASSAANEDATPTFSSSVNSRSLTEVSVSMTGALRQPSLTLANPRGEVKHRETKRRETTYCRGVQHLTPRRAIVSAAARAKLAPTRSEQGDFCRQIRPAILLDCHGREIPCQQPLETKGRTPARCCSCRIAHALRALHHLRLPGARFTRGGRRFSARQLARQVRAAGARSFAMPHRRRADVPALRLPRATGAFAAENRPRSVLGFGVPAAGRTRHRLDEQIARL